MDTEHNSINYDKLCAPNCTEILSRYHSPTSIELFSVFEVGIRCSLVKHTRRHQSTATNAFVPNTHHGPWPHQELKNLDKAAATLRSLPARSHQASFAANGPRRTKGLGATALVLL